MKSLYLFLLFIKLVFVSLADKGIIIEQNRINCGPVLCPYNSFKCSVKIESIDNATNIVTERNCIDVSGSILLQSITTTPNINIGSSIKAFSEVDINGNTISCYDCNNADEAIKQKSNILKT